MTLSDSIMVQIRKNGIMRMHLRIARTCDDLKIEESTNIEF